MWVGHAGGPPGPACHWWGSPLVLRRLGGCLQPTTASFARESVACKSRPVGQLAFLLFFMPLDTVLPVRARTRRVGFLRRQRRSAAWPHHAADAFAPVVFNRSRRRTREVRAASKPRQFSAAELLFAWLAEPENGKPCCSSAADESLRSDLLELPLYDDQGRAQIRFAATDRRGQEVTGSGWKRSSQQDEMRKAGSTGVAAVDKKARELDEAYSLYRQLTFDPSRSAESRTWAPGQRVRIGQEWMAWRTNCSDAGGGGSAGVRRPGGEGFGGMRKLVAPMMDAREHGLATRRRTPSRGGVVERTAELAAEWRRTWPTGREAGQIAAEARRRTLRRSRPNGGRWPRGGEMARLATRGPLVVFRRGRGDPPGAGHGTDRVGGRPIPERDAAVDRFPGRLHGSNELLHRYPKDKLAWSASRCTAMAAYRDRKDPSVRSVLPGHDGRFRGRIRAMAEAIEAAAPETPDDERDESILAATAYPPAGSMGPELLYNRLDPFFWSWLVASWPWPAWLLAMATESASRCSGWPAPCAARPASLCRVRSANGDHALGADHEHVRDDLFGGAVRGGADALADVLPLWARDGPAPPGN